MKSRVVRALALAAVAAGVACWSTRNTSAASDCRVSWNFDGYTLNTLGELTDVSRDDRPQYFFVDWGDGSSVYSENNLLMGTAYMAQTHTYSDIGTYTVHFQVGDQSGVCFDFAQAVFIPNQ